MSIDLTSYKPLYLKTAKEYAVNMKAACIKLKDNNSETEAIQNIYIAAHSLKSQSLIMGYKETGAVCSLIETKFRIIKESQGKVPEELLNLTMEASDFLDLQIINIEKENIEMPSLEICRKLETAEVKITQ